MLTCSWDASVYGLELHPAPRNLVSFDTKPLYCSICWVRSLLQHADGQTCCLF